MRFEEAAITDWMTVDSRGHIVEDYIFLIHGSQGSRERKTLESKLARDHGQLYKSYSLKLYQPIISRCGRMV